MGCALSAPAAPSLAKSRTGRAAWEEPAKELEEDSTVLENALNCLEPPPPIVEQPAVVIGQPISVVQQPQQPAVQRLAVRGDHRVCKGADELPFDIEVVLASPQLLTEVEVAAPRALASPGRLEVRVDGALVAVGSFQEAAKPRLGAALGREPPLRCRLEVDEPADHVSSFTLRVTSRLSVASHGEEGASNVEISEVVPRGLPAGGEPPFKRLVQPPRYWSTVGEPQRRRVDLREESRVAVFQRMLDETWKACATRDRRGLLPRRLAVRKVQRVEAPALWNRFARKRRQMAKRAGGCTALEQLDGCGGDGLVPVRTQHAWKAAPELLGPCDGAVNEHYLFHGTSPAAALGIIQTGFDLSKAGSSTGLMLGPGAYFAEASSKFDEYARADEFSGMCAVLVCRVLCGNMFRALGKPDPNMLTDPGFAARYDGILGDREASVGTYREFVVFTPEQIYPEYLVIYDRIESE